MGNSLRCCLACVIPCGALDLIRIVHLNGQVEEIAHPITAGEVLNNNPNHVLSKPSSSQGMVRRIVILSPESELKRGSIYFLIPATSVPDRKKNKKILHPATKNPSKKMMMSKRVYHVNAAAMTTSETTDHCLRDVVPPSEKKSSCRRHRRRSGKVGIWRPHLESISED